MKTQIIKPHEVLSDVIDHYFIRKSTNSTEINQQYPSLSQELVFNFSDQVEFRNEQKMSYIKAGSAYLKGIHVKPLTCISSENHYSIGIVFKPWGLYKMFGLKSSSYTNKIIDAGAVIDYKYLQFIFEYAKIYSAIDVLNNLESWLLKNNKNIVLTEEFIDAFSQFDESNTQKGAISKVSKGIDLCPKSFIERFKTIIGVTPIQYLHIKQINIALNLLRERPSLALTQLSNDLGFYDQAHFIRVFKAYCNVTPGQCRKQFYSPLYKSNYEALSA